MGNLTMVVTVPTHHIQPSFAADAHAVEEVEVLVEISAGYCREENFYWVEAYSFTVAGVIVTLDAWAERFVLDYVRKNIR